MIEEKYKKNYDEFIKQYKEIHICPWHNISEEELNEIYTKLINNMDVNDDSSFLYLMNYIIKRLSGTTDAHTKVKYEDYLPLIFRIVENDVLVTYPNSIKNSSLVSINNVDIKKIMSEIDDVITYGTDGKKRFETEKYLFNRGLLFGLPSLKNDSSLKFEFKDNDGNYTEKVYDKNTNLNDEEHFDHAEYLFGKNNTTYRIVNDSLIYIDSSLQYIFKDKINTAIDNLRKEDLSKVNKIIIDLRGNNGGNSSLNKPLIAFLKENKDKKIIALTDYRVFSAGRYALIDLINLGATTIGEKISTPINCFGNSHWIHIGDFTISISDSYFDPSKGIDIESKEDYIKRYDLLPPNIFTPDIPIKLTKKDYINGIDRVLDIALSLDKK